MRDDHEKFVALGAKVLVVTRHNLEQMKAYWKKERLPYQGIADPDGRITARYSQQWRLFRLGRMPALFVIDSKGKIVFAHYSSGMSDIPKTSTVLEEIRRAGK